MREEIKDGFEFVPMLYPFNQKDAIKIMVDTKKIDDYKAYIRAHGIEKAEIIMPDLKILKSCPTLKHLRICPSYNTFESFDFTPLYEASEIKSLNCQNQYGDRKQYISEIDYSRIQGLTHLFVSVNKGTLNFNKVETLKSLCVGGFVGRGRDLTDLFCSKELDTIRLVECGIQSLDGIDTSPKLQCLYLHHNRILQDIGALHKVKGSLRALRIENCSRIKDFSVLGDLDNLELLELSGSNVIPSLDFLETMKSLKTFTFNMNVLDGDLSRCLTLSYVFSEINRKHYNLKDANLPKGRYIRGNETIEIWRRLE